MNSFETKSCRKCKKLHNDELKTCNPCLAKER